MHIGTSFSPKHAAFIGLDPLISFHALIPSRFDLVRLGCYWNEIEKEKKAYDFDSLHRLLEICEKHDQHIVMTIGMKAPRWPEFYIPDWVTSDRDKRLFEYLEISVNTLKHYPCITHWQVENEPLDPSGPEQKTISFELLRKEVELVRKLDNTRPIVVTAWGNALTKRCVLERIAPLADIVGLDLYYKVPTRGFLKNIMYRGPQDDSQTLSDCITQTNKPVWITELQAEPWEEYDFYAKPQKTPSFDLEQWKINMLNAKKLDPKAILLWGIEYWLYQIQKGNKDYQNALLQLKNTK